MDIFRKVLDKFLRYVKIGTDSDENSGKTPSTEKQKTLASMLAKELTETGAEVFYDEKNCCVYGKIHSNKGSGCKRVAFISHLDTSPEVSGTGVKPIVRENYDGKDIDISGSGTVVLSMSKFPSLKNYIGKTIVTSDGSTLLGADDKAGIAEIMTAAEYFYENPEVKHGEISICFTPDEEIGEGTDHIDLEKLAADFAYTVDGGTFGEIEYENFNAASAKITVNGISVHPGDAKNKMVNASLVAMEINEMLPKECRPDCTEGYEGFYHLTDMRGTVEKSELSYIIRDHDMEKFEEKKRFISEICDKINEKYGKNTCDIVLKDQYYNMKEKICPDYAFLVENALKIISELGTEPVVKPIRGGTDGARLSFMGIPCPNLCTGGENYHGRYEYCCVESMEQTVKLLIELAKIY